MTAALSGRRRYSAPGVHLNALANRLRQPFATLKIGGDGTGMNIAVAVRLMPNVGDELEIDDDGKDIDREVVDMVINDFDDQALEEAVLLKEATGATVTAVGLGT